MIYSVVLFFLLRRIYDGMQEKYEILLQATGKMADGNLEMCIRDSRWGMLIHIRPRTA